MSEEDLTVIANKQNRSGGLGNVINSIETVTLSISTMRNSESFCLHIDPSQKIQVRENKGNLKVFVFEQNQDLDYFDFGFWNEAKVVFQSW